MLTAERLPVPFSSLGIDSMGWNPNTMAQPRPTRPSPSTSVTQGRYSATRPITSARARPSRPNTARNPADSDRPTTWARLRAISRLSVVPVAVPVPPF